MLIKSERYGLRVYAERALIALGFLALFSLPRRMWVDGKDRFIALSRLLDHGDTSPASLYSLVGPLFSAPLWYLGKLVKDPEFWCVSYNFILFWIALGLFYGVFRRRLGNEVARRFVVLMIFASMFPFHLRHYYGEVFSAFAVALGALAIQERGREKGGWAAVVLGVANAPAMALGLVFMSVARWWRTRKLTSYLPVVATVVLILAERWLRRGSPWASGYERSAGAGQFSSFTQPFVFGLVSILFSFGKGLLVYVPGLCLPVRGDGVAAGSALDRAHRMWIACLLGMVLLYSKWWAWFGGWFWGPRFFLMASIPASLALALLMQRARTIGAVGGALALLSWAFWVGLCSAVFGQDTLERCEAAESAHLCWYVPEFSPLLRPLLDHRTFVPRDYFLFACWGVAYCVLAGPLWARLGAELLNGVKRLRHSKN